LSGAFESLAADYDRQFSGSSIGRRMRQAVWQRCQARFRPGSRVLEMNCGTGEDAVHLAQLGVQVLATDVADAMIDIARAKVRRAGVESQVRVQRLAWEELGSLGEGAFDGVLSNFGGLNCVASIESIRAPLAARLMPGAVAMLCIMGPLVPWEWLWYLSHGQPRRAFRRLRPGGLLWRDARIRYPSIGRVGRALRPEFRVLRVSAIGALLPPPYTGAWAERFPRLLERLDAWERRLEAMPPLPWLADHYLLELERL
jgi:SAM-dependent methyltransferase